MIRERVTKRQLRATVWLLCLLLLVGSVLLMSRVYPVEWIFDPNTPIISDAEAGSVPEVVYYREIKVPFLGEYAGTVRDLSTGDVFFDFPYNQKPAQPYETNMKPDPTTGMIVGRTSTVDLCWWTGDHPRCRMETPGKYVVSTCWRIRWYGWGSFLNALGPRFICRPSNAFTVFAGEDISEADE